MIGRVDDNHELRLQRIANNEATDMINERLVPCFNLLIRLKQRLIVIFRSLVLISTVTQSLVLCWAGGSYLGGMELG
jgi:hypothetical protein